MATSEEILSNEIERLLRAEGITLSASIKIRLLAAIGNSIDLMAEGTNPVIRLKRVRHKTTLKEGWTHPASVQGTPSARFQIVHWDDATISGEDPVDLVTI